MSKIWERERKTLCKKSKRKRENMKRKWVKKKERKRDIMREYTKREFWAKGNHSWMITVLSLIYHTHMDQQRKIKTIQEVLGYDQEVVDQHVIYGSYRVDA